MQTEDPLFSRALEYIDKGQSSELYQLLEENPLLTRIRLEQPSDGYFSHPYLLYFIADNPIRTGRLADNLLQTTRVLVEGIRKHSNDVLADQLNYTLGLLATGRTAAESGQQIALMDLLLDAGAIPANIHGALAHGNIIAAAHLLNRGATSTLAAAVCLNRIKETNALLQNATTSEKELALVAAAYYGNAEMVSRLIAAGTNTTARVAESTGFHSHATALHQAVQSRSLETVNLLLQAGADTLSKDKIYSGTPLDWAIHLAAESSNEGIRLTYQTIRRCIENFVAPE